ncbi:MAG: hypothetical protein ACR2O1_16185 [Boseongicola sp.]
MSNSKLLAVITALIYLGGHSGAHAAYSIEQLREIEQLITSKNCGGLRGYLHTNPEIIEGADPLAEELRKFAFGVDTGLIQCLAARSTVPSPAIEELSTANVDLLY